MEIRAPECAFPSGLVLFALIIFFIPALRPRGRRTLSPPHVYHFTMSLGGQEVAALQRLGEVATDPRGSGYFGRGFAREGAGPCAANP